MSDISHIADTAYQILKDPVMELAINSLIAMYAIIKSNSSKTLPQRRLLSKKSISIDSIRYNYILSI